ncbi:hypothetical protein BCU23_20005 [Vibrio splendidus]|nr:hypothetical protein BCU23_20005 [Vibrio splendidus]
MGTIFLIVNDIFGLVLMGRVTQIIDLLSDESFPSVLLLDGAWGSGKTHFVNTELKGALEYKFKKDVLFFSLYGISSVGDFRDKLISLMLSDGDSTKIATFMSKAVDGLAQNMGERGVGALISGVAGAYKHALFSKLRDYVLILDDLERVSQEESIKHILGECLNLAESKGFKIVVVANEDKIGCKEDIEKVFVDKVKFSLTNEELFSFVVGEYQDVLSGSLTNELSLLVSTLKIRNIRVLKRGLNRFKALHNLVTKDDSLSTELALSKLLDQTIRTCYAIYERGLDAESIVSAVESQVFRRMASRDEDESVERKFKEHDEIFPSLYTSIPKSLIEFCSNGVLSYENLAQDFDLPVAAKPIEAVTSYWSRFRIDDDTFNKGVLALQNAIDNPQDMNIAEWFGVCSTYISLLKDQTLDTTFGDEAQIVAIASKVKVTDFLPLPRDYDRFFRGESYLGLQDIFESKYSEHSSLSGVRDSSEFIVKFKQSLANVYQEIADNKSHKPLLNHIGIDNFEHAFREWRLEELFDFGRLLSSRYNFSNLSDYFSDELTAMTEMLALIEQLKKEWGSCRRTGALALMQQRIELASKKLAETEKELSK